MGMGMGFLENSQLKMPSGRCVIVNASWMDRVSVAYMYLPGTAFEIWQCRCKDPNNLNDQIQGPCNDAAAGPNGSGKQWGVEQWIVEWECMSSIILVSRNAVE